MTSPICLLKSLRTLPARHPTAYHLHTQYMSQPLPFPAPVPDYAMRLALYNHADTLIAWALPCLMQ